MGLIQRLSQWGFSKKSESELKHKNHEILRRCHFEIMEPRRVLSADPVIAGVTYEEGDSGQDSAPDYFEVSFQGGGDTTRLTQFTINGDQDSSGTLTDGDMFFDVDGSMPGTGGYHAFVFDAANSTGVSASDVRGIFVGPEGLSLTVQVDNFEAGDVFAFTIDVDEVERFRFDKIASGVEFEGSFFQTRFVDENYTFEDLSVTTNTPLEGGFVQPQRDGIFYDSYDQLFSESENYSNGRLDLNADNQDGHGNRTAGAIDAFELVPKPITISGNVFHDADLDCDHATNLGGIQGVEIQLEKLNSTTGEYEGVATTTTDADGRYEFGLEFDLTPGVYRLVELQPDGYLDVGAAVGNVEGTASGQIQDDLNQNANVIADINIPLGGTSATDYDFKEVRPASLSGNVFHDRNDNGIRENGEEGIANVLIKVTRLGAKEGVVDDPFADMDAIFVRTDADGRYRVEQLPPGIYEVIEINNYPPNQDPLAAYLDGKDSIGNVGGQTIGRNSMNDQYTQIELCADDDGVEFNFGELKPAAISGYVSVETPGEAKLDPTNPGFRPIEGVTIQLFNDAGDLVATTVTDPSGLYEFSGLRNGTYSIVEVQPDGYLDGGDFVGNIGGARTGSNSVNDRLDGIRVGSGQQGTRYDFTEFIPASVQGTVYYDRNDSGDQDDGEEGIGGVVVQLYDIDGNLVDVLRTDARGEYEFSGLLAGEYTIREVQPATFVDGKESVGSVLKEDGSVVQSGYVSGNDQFRGIVLAGGDLGTEFNFGEIRFASISGSVQADADGDKSNFDPTAGDRMLEGVEIVLFNRGGDEIARTVTDADGNYQFTGLRPGVYSVREIGPAGYIDGVDSIGTVDGQRQGVLENDFFSGIVLRSGSNAVNYNFCESIPGEIRGFVYFDLDDNGNFDARERGIEGVTLKLFSQSGDFVAETQTTSNGEYWFTNLLPGVYRVQEIQPQTYVDGQDQLGTVNGSVKGNATNDLFTQIRVNGGEVGINYNFGELRLAEISGNVHLSVDGNCVFDTEGGDSPVSGVTLQLLNSDGDVVATTTTDSNGSYTFANLLPGEYSVRQVQPGEYFTGGESVGDGGGESSENLLTGIVIESGQKLTRYDFCENEAAVIRGRVWEDGPAFRTESGNVPDGYREMRDGFYQPGVDSPIAGVRMRLYYLIDPTTQSFNPRPVTFGEVMAEDYVHMGTEDLSAPIWVETAANGLYSFRGLQAGNYIVLEEQPENFVDANERAGTTSGLVFNSLSKVRGADGNLRLFSTVQLMDAIVSIPVVAGGVSSLNNFTEVRAVALPPEPTLFRDPGGPGPRAQPLVNPLTPQAGLTGQSGLAGAQGTRYDAFARSSTGLTSVGQLAQPYSWHLSVVNAGAPRSVVEALEEGSGIWHQAGYLNSTDWQRFEMNESTWSFTNTRSNGDIVNIDRQVRFGMADGIPISGDFDGDGTDEVAVFKDGYWMIDINRNGRWDEADLLVKLGDDGDRPIVGDWDGDGKDDVGIFGPIWEGDAEAIAREPGLANPENNSISRPKNIPPVEADSTSGARVMKLTSFGRQRADVIDHVFGSGVRSDAPVTGDWNGNGIDSIGRFKDGIWHLDVNGDGRFNHHDAVVDFGRVGDVPLAGDFDGDGIDEIAVFRAGTFIIDSNGNREMDATDKTFEMGSGADQPVIGDWDGDGVDEPGLYRAARVSNR